MKKFSFYYHKILDLISLIIYLGVLYNQIQPTTKGVILTFFATILAAIGLALCFGLGFVVPLGISIMCRLTGLLLYPVYLIMLIDGLDPNVGFLNGIPFMHITLPVYFVWCVFNLYTYRKAVQYTDGSYVAVIYID